MSRQQKARSTVAAAEQAAKEKTSGGGTSFEDQFITARAGRQGRVSGLLRAGADQAIPTRELVTLAGFRSARELQQEIAREREDGALILSKSDGGYFLASTREELEAFHRTLSARALSTLAALKSTRKALDRLDGQTELPGAR